MSDEKNEFPANDHGESDRASANREAVRFLKGLGRYVKIGEDGEVVEASIFADSGTALRDLELNNTQITDAGLQHLSHLKNLSYVELTDEQITAAGITAAGLHHPTA